MSWLLAFAGFALLIILHEFGHFIAAKWTGMRVERFFLFFPPKLWSFKRGETEYGIGWLPLGGFVKITGMNPDEVDPPPGQEERVREVGLLEKVESVDQNPDPDVSVPGRPLPPELRERAYYNQPVWKRIVVIAAGPAMNVLVAFVLLFGLAYTAEEISGPGLEIAELTTDSPAQGQLEEGDKVVSIDGMALSDQDGGDRADNFRDQIGTHTCAGDADGGVRGRDPGAGRGRARWRAGSGHSDSEVRPGCGAGADGRSVRADRSHLCRTRRPSRRRNSRWTACGT